MTDAVKIYHNPRCSKSRDTLSLLKSNGIDPDVVLYLDTPPDAQTLSSAAAHAGNGSARELMRQKEDLYKSLNLDDTYLSEDQLIQAMVENPKLGLSARLWWQTVKHASAVRRKMSSTSSSPTPQRFQKRLRRTFSQLFLRFTPVINSHSVITTSPAGSSFTRGIISRSGSATCSALCLCVDER